MFCIFNQETQIGAGASYGGDREILDEVITRSRGEIRHLSSPKITSSTATPAHDSKSTLQSPRPSFSPRVSELKGEKSPCGGRGPHSPRTGEKQLSHLGKSPSNSASG